MEDIRVTSQNYELLRRLDSNQDGVIEVKEANAAADRAGAQKLNHEAQGLDPHDLSLIKAMATKKGQAVALTFGEARTRIGSTDGQTPWQQVQQTLNADAAAKPAPLGTVGQERPGALSNNDCGPTSALFMHDLRLQRATGQAPARTHAQADALIARMSKVSGTTAPQMAGIMNDHFRHAGGEFYTFAAHPFTPVDLMRTLMTGLSADPGGVMVPIISTYDATQTAGTRHWIVVTGFAGRDVTFYDPAGPDGAQHQGRMAYDDLVNSLEADPPFGDRAVVYGTHRPAADVPGDLKTGAKVAELDVRLLNRDITVTSQHGVYGTQADADAAAQRVAKDTGEDAVVRREPNGFAVYGVTEIRTQYGGLWSANALTDIDRRVTAVWMTDATSGEVRKAP